MHEKRRQSELTDDLIAFDRDMMTAERREELTASLRQQLQVAEGAGEEDVAADIRANLEMAESITVVESGV